MKSSTTSQLLAPQSPAGSWTLELSEAYCRSLAGSHYENFAVASLFLPRHLKQHFYNVYAYCRISDDLGDESGDPQTALSLLEQWETLLSECYQGRVHHPVFIALKQTIDRFEIPMAPFADLLAAFKLDQIKNRYKTFEELLDYCRDSANPVGRLVLYLFGYRDEERQRLSDATCTALQLANHWQDVSEDLRRLDRIYIPQDDMQRFQYTEEDLKQNLCDGRFVGLMKLEVQRARELFLEGARLGKLLPRNPGIEIDAFSRCGMEVLSRIEAVDYDVLHRRPTLPKWLRMKILLQCWWRRAGS